MQLIDRAMQVTEIIASSETKKWFSISELSNECDLPASTLHRLLTSMKKHGLIQQDPDSKLYSMGNKWLEYGLQMYDSFDFVSLIRPEMERLMLEVEESIYFSKPIGLESLVIERIDCTTNPIRINDQLGIRIPMHIGAANKVMLAHMSDNDALQILNSLLPEEKRESFIHLLMAIKKQGYGVSHAEKTKGTSSVAAPVFNHANELIGAISIGYVNFNVTEDRQSFLIEKIREYAMRISAKLGYKL